MIAKSGFRAEQIQNSSLPFDFVCDPANCYICHSVRVNKRLDALTLLKRDANQIEVAPRLATKRHNVKKHDIAPQRILISFQRSLFLFPSIVTRCLDFTNMVLRQ